MNIKPHHQHCNVRTCCSLRRLTSKCEYSINRELIAHTLLVKNGLEL